MGRLIDTDEYEKRIKPYDTEDVMDKALYNFAHNNLITTPTAQPKRKTGKWVRCDEDGFRNMSKCPECGAMIDIKEEFRSLFCYHCGLKMIGVQK